MGDAQPLGDGRKPARHHAVGAAAEHQRKQDVVLNAEGVQQVEILKHKAQMIPAEGAEGLVAQLGDVVSVQQHLA